MKESSIPNINSEPLLHDRICKINSLGNYSPISWLKVREINILFKDDYVSVWFGSSKDNKFKSLFIKFNLVCYQFNLNESSLYLLQDDKWEIVAQNNVIIQLLRITLLKYSYVKFNNTNANIQAYGVGKIYRDILLAISLVKAKYENINPKIFDYSCTWSYFKFIDWFIKKHATTIEKDIFLKNGEI